MQRFYTIAFIFCLLVKLNLGNDNNDTNEQMNADPQSKYSIVPGGYTDKDPNDPLYKKMAEASLKTYQQISGANRIHKVLQVQKVTVQVVAGWLTRINYAAAPTNCLLNSNMQPDDSLCAVSDLSNLLLCSSETLEQPWLENTEIKVSCFPIPYEPVLSKLCNFFDSDLYNSTST